MMLRFVVLAICIALIEAQRDLLIDESPKPYSFEYDITNEDGGRILRDESADGTGRVTGSYSLEDPDGRRRLVQYVADADGFRANIQTNEEGTANQNPADVVIESSAPSALGPPRAGPPPRVPGPPVIVPRPPPPPQPRPIRPIVPPPPPPPAPRPNEEAVIVNGRRFILVPADSVRG